MMEMAVAAYEKYKIMVVFPVEMGYRPFGVLGGIAQTNDDCSEAHLDTVTPEEFNKVGARLQFCEFGMEYDMQDSQQP